MLTRLMKSRDDRDAGFTLIELLVVVAIIGILAAIAIPVFLSQRDNAANSGAEAEIKNAATSLEVFYTEGGAYPALAAINTATGPTITVSDNVAIDYTLAADGNSYTLVGCNVDTNLMYTWDSAEGSFTGTPAENAVACAAIGLPGDLR